MSLELVDIGVNLDHASFHNDREQVIQNALNKGVKVMILTGTTIKSSKTNAALAGKYPKVLYATAGIHPHNARNCDSETIKTLSILASQPEVVALGECGLDFNRDFSPRPLQLRWFEAQVELACQLKKPLFLHERDAHHHFIDILAKYRKDFSYAVVHCFTGDSVQLQSYLELDLYIGITGWICDERRGQHLQKLVSQIPLNRLMLETDAPFLTPRNIFPKPKEGRNEPAYLTYVLKTVAQSLGKTEIEVAQETTKTARTFFQLPS